MKEMRGNPNDKTHHIGLIGHYKALTLTLIEMETLWGIGQKSYLIYLYILKTTLATVLKKTQKEEGIEESRETIGIVMIWWRSVGSLGQDVSSSHWEVVGFLIGLTSESKIFVDTLEVRQRKKEELKIPPIPYLEQKLLWMELNFQQWFFNGILLQFSCSVVSNSLRHHGLQHARPPCPSPTPGVYWNSRPLSWWCHPTISSSAVPFSSSLQFFPASGSFQMSHFFT